MCDLLLEESNVQPVSTPVTICGDIHGQVCLCVRVCMEFRAYTLHSALLWFRLTYSYMYMHTCVLNKHNLLAHVHIFFLLQFYDLEELFRTGGNIPDTSYVFMVNIRDIKCTCTVCVYMYYNTIVVCTTNIYLFLF